MICYFRRTIGAQDNCFAIMMLNGPSANVEYYTVPLLRPAVKLNVRYNN